MLKGSEDTSTTKCWLVILSRLENDRRLPPRFHYGPCYLTEASLLSDRQRHWMDLLLSTEHSPESGSREEAEICEAHRRVEKVLRPATLAAADSIDLPVMDAAASLRNESEDEANESEVDEDDDYEEHMANDSENKEGDYQEDKGNISEEDKGVMMEM
ncbi:MAG: hypothetical protein Q9224_007375 [Gallowayella concinna]